MPHAADVVLTPERTAAAPDGRGVKGSTDPVADDYAAGAPQPGTLGIKQPRSWKTWQLVVAVAVALVIGMIIGNSGGGGATPKPAAKGYTVPPPAGSGSQTSSPTTSGPASSPATSAPTATAPTSTPSTTAPAATGPVVVLLPQVQSRGAYTSTPFTVGASGWNIGWAYQCTPAPASGPAFQIFVVPAGGSPGTTPAVNETAASGQSVTTQTLTGSLELDVQAPASCLWAIKVTGVA